MHTFMFVNLLIANVGKTHNLHLIDTHKRSLANNGQPTSLMASIQSLLVRSSGHEISVAVRFKPSVTRNLYGCPLVSDIV